MELIISQLTLQAPQVLMERKVLQEQQVTTGLTELTGLLGHRDLKVSKVYKARRVLQDQVLSTCLGLSMTLTGL